MSITKKVFVSAFVAAFALVAMKANAAYVHTVTLKQGSSGSQVMALQQTLNMTSCKVAAAGAGAPGMETTHFGPATKAAVMCFQASHSLKADGIVGPATGAAIAAVTGSTTTGGTTATPGCPAGAMYNYMTGAPCSGSTSGSTSLQGDAGDITITNTSSDVEDTVTEGDGATKVLGFKVEASGSDVAVKSLKVTLDTPTGSGSTRIERYVDSVSVYEGSTKVGSADISDFSKSGTTYTKSVTLDNAIVREGSGNKQTFYVEVTPVNNIDSADLSNTWKVTASDVRYVDAQGATLSTSSWSGNNYATFGFQTLSNSGDVKFKVSQGSGNPDAGNVEVSDTGSTSDVLMLEFKLNAQGTDVDFDTVKIDAAATGANLNDIASTFYLKHGSDQLADVDATAATSATLTFNLDDTYTVSAGSTDTFRVYAKINKIATASFAQGDALKVSFNDVNGEDSNGDAITETGSALGNTQTFYSEGIAVTNFTSKLTSATNTSGQKVSGTYDISFDVTAFGNTFYIPTTLVRGTTDASAGLTYTIEDGSGATTTTAGASAATLTSSANIVGGYFEVPEGSTVTLKTQVVITKGSDGADFYRVQLNDVGYDTNQAGSVTDTPLLPAQNFETGQISIEA